jgi:RNA polymerase sigma factor (sigma-70 family)
LKQDVWQILESHAPAVHALLFRLTLRRDVADELLHELLVKMAPRLTAENPGGYLRRAAINLAMDWRRRRRRRREGSLPDDSRGDATKDVAREIEDAEDVERILEAAESLPELARQAFVLRYVQEESYDAVGAAIDRTAHQARGLCHSAVVEIRKRLGPREVRHE